MTQCQSGPKIIFLHKHFSLELKSMQMHQDQLGLDTKFMEVFLYESFKFRTSRPTGPALPASVVATDFLVFLLFPLSPVFPLSQASPLSPVVHAVFSGQCIPSVPSDASASYHLWSPVRLVARCLCAGTRRPPSPGRGSQDLATEDQLWSCDLGPWSRQSRQ